MKKYIIRYLTKKLFDQVLKVEYKDEKLDNDLYRANCAKLNDDKTLNHILNTLQKECISELVKPNLTYLHKEQQAHHRGILYAIAQIKAELEQGEVYHLANEKMLNEYFDEK